MAEHQAAASRKPCCVCAEPGGQHCTKCKSRHYCSKKCQLVDWYERGHKAQCRELAAKFQDRTLVSLMPEKLKVKEAPPIFKDVLQAYGSKALISAVGATATATVMNDGAPDWRGTCAICLELQPAVGGKTFYECCCCRICTACHDKCNQYDERCPLCRAPRANSDAEWVRRIQKHADEGNADAQVELAHPYRNGLMGLEQSSKRAFQLYELAAAHGHAVAQHAMGIGYELGNGVEIDHKTAALWYRRAAEQGFPDAQFSLGLLFDDGKGVAQSYEEAAKWFRLAAAQGLPEALFNLAVCYHNGDGVPRDVAEARCLYKRAAAEGHAGAAAAAGHALAHVAIALFVAVTVVGAAAAVAGQVLENVAVLLALAVTVIGAQRWAAQA